MIYYHLYRDLDIEKLKKFLSSYSFTNELENELEVKIRIITNRFKFLISVCYSTKLIGYAGECSSDEYWNISLFRIYDIFFLDTDKNHYIVSEIFSEANPEIYKICYNIDSRAQEDAVYFNSKEEMIEAICSTMNNVVRYENLESFS